MKIIKTIIKSLMKIKLDVGNMTSISELVKYINFRTIEVISFYLLLLWTISPLLVIIQSLFVDNTATSALYFDRLILNESWHKLLLQIGYLGIIVFSIKVAISFYDYEDFKKNIDSNIIIMLLFIMLIWAYISTYFSRDYYLSLFGTAYRREGFITYLAYFGIFILGISMKREMLIRRILVFFSIISFILSLLMIIDNSHINKIIMLFPNSVIFYNINHFGYYLCMAIMASVGLILQKSGRPQIFIYTTMYSVLILALVMNMSFGPYLAIINGLFFLSVFIWRFKEEIKNRLLVV